MTKTRYGRALPFLCAGIGLLVLSGCGGDDFADKPRPALPVELTGVIQEKKVTISPDETGSGAVRITIANETNESHTVTLEGENVEERVGPINPQDAATINKTLEQGTYEVVAGSELATREIAPGKLVIGPPRDPSNNQLLQP
ncbi:MAG: hypothetical protein WD649_00545 [Thermoleophilaceae bacterium]